MEPLGRYERCYSKLASIKEKYDVISSQYDELYGDEQMSKYDVIIKRLSRLRGKLLDAGGGSLLFERYLLNQESLGDLWLIALEISNIVVRPYSEIKANLSLDAVIGDLMSHPFRESVFDIVVSITVLGGYGECFEEALRSLSTMRKKGGLALITLHRKTISRDELESIDRLGADCRDAGTDIMCVF